MLGSSVDIIDKPVMTVGHQAADGYGKETGHGQVHGLGGITAEALRDAASYAAGLLGSSYSDLVEADRRGRGSPTPPPKRHRLVELIEYADHAAELMERPGPTQVVLNGDLISEIATFVSLFRRWSNHPEWPKLVGTLKHPTEEQHSLMLLAVASYLADAGNGTGIVGDTSGGRIADLWIEPTILERLEVEVKTPQGLRGPLGAALTINEAERVIERQVKDAASTKSGQLDPRHSGVLAIGGYHLGSGSLDVLESAARRVLSRQAERKRHLAAILVCELSYQMATVLGRPGDPITSSFTPVLGNRLIQHPGYGGGLQIHQADQAWQTFVPPSSQQALGKHSRSRSMSSDEKARNRRRKAQRESRRHNRRP